MPLFKYSIPSAAGEIVLPPLIVSGYVSVAPAESSFDLPLLSVLAGSASSGSLSLPVISLSARQGNTATAALALPVLDIAGVGAQGNNAQGVVSIHGLRCSAYTASAASFELPLLKLSGSAQSSPVASCAIAIPCFSVSATGDNRPTNSADGGITLPSFFILARTRTQAPPTGTDAVLKYERKRRLI